jgi:hypothetical protein
MSDAVSVVRDRLIFLGWIAGLFAAAALIWILARPAQERYLLRAVNHIFIVAGDQRRLAEPATAPADSPPGYWYSMFASNDRLFVFGIMRDGIFIPCGARIGESGSVEEIIPLGFHAARALDTMPREIVRMYIRRIEAAVSGRGS